MVLDEYDDRLRSSILSSKDEIETQGIIYGVPMWLWVLDSRDRLP